MSDQYLTHNCGILAHLLPGDQILWQIVVLKSKRLYCAEISISPFTRGKKQLSKMEIDTARQLSCVRIHVERVIGLLRQMYTLLQSTLPNNLIMATYTLHIV